MPRPTGPAKGKAKVKITASGRKVSYGQKGAKVKAGTSKGDSYCARSAGQMKNIPRPLRTLIALYVFPASVGSVRAPRVQNSLTVHLIFDIIGIEVYMASFPPTAP